MPKKSKINEYSDSSSILSHFIQTFLHKLCVEAIQIPATGERLLKWFVMRIMFNVDLQNWHKVLLFAIRGSSIDRWWWGCSHLSAVCSHRQSSGQFLILPTACQHIQNPLIADKHNYYPKQLAAGPDQKPLRFVSFNLLGSFLMFSNFYRLDLHNKIWLALQTYDGAPAKNRIENQIFLI